MISGIELRNFKCFRDAQIRFAPLTLLTGYNAAGKSTSLQPLLLLAQAYRQNRYNRRLELNGPLVRLGTVGDVLASHSDERTIRIAVKTAFGALEWNLTPGETSNLALGISSVRELNAGTPRVLARRVLWPEQMPGAHLQALMETLRRISFLSAMRGGTSEVCPLPDSTSSFVDIGSAGEFSAWWYTRAADDEIPENRRHPSETGTTLRRQLDAFMSDIFHGGGANAEVVPRTSVTRLEFRSSPRGDWRRPANIGYGLSYAFPILVALLMAQSGQVVMIDSPEAHLHPHGQSIIGKQMAHFASAGIQVVVETHSDHVLNGVRLAVRDGKLAASDVAIHFFSADKTEGSGIFSPRLNSDGALSEWPNGFFDQSELDLARLSGMDD